MLEYELKIRRSDESPKAFKEALFREMKSRTKHTLVWRDAWDDSEPTITTCYFTFAEDGLYNLAAVAHGYWTPEGDGVSKGKARILVNKNILDDFRTEE